MTETQFLAPDVRPDEDELERSLRPRRLDEFVAQERIKEQLAIALEATRTRGEALDHLLLIGPPGLGKTSLAYIVREELGVGPRSAAGPAPGPRRRRGAARGRDHDRDRPRGARAARGRRARARADGPRAAARDRGEVRRRPCWPLDAGGRPRRGAGHDRGCLRAVPAPARL